MRKLFFSKISALLLGVIAVAIGIGVHAGQLSIVPSSGTRYVDCYQAYQIIMDTEGISTNSVDAKFFHTNDFSFNTASGYTTYSGTDMDILAVVNSIGNPFYTGTTGGNEYTYINAYQNVGNPIAGSNVLITTVYLKPDATGTGEINFHYYAGGVNGDDSNISSGINNDTQYVDVLTSVINGSYDITGNQFCPENPYILESTYQQYTYQTTATGVTRVYTTIVGGPHYLEQYTIDDNTYNTWTNSTGWTIWTKLDYTKDSEYTTGILMSLTGNEDIQMISVQMFDDPNITAIGDVASGRVQLRQFRITGNIYTGYVTFDDDIGNVGNTYQSGADLYVDTFNIDAFWIDTVAPNVLTSSIATGDGFEDIYLSGQASSGASDATNGRHNSGMLMDDQFAIYEFSGTNTTKYGYATVTGYNADLINLYGGEAGSGWSMDKTLKFTQSWSGYVLFIDRAGNTGSVFIDVQIEAAAEFGIYTKPAFRENAGNFHGRNGEATTGEFWLAYNDQGTWIFTHNSAISGDPKVTTTSTGFGTVSVVVPASGTEYLAVFKGSGMLAVGFTGIWTNDIFDTASNYFDFTSGTNNIGTVSTLFPELVYSDENYIKQGDVSLATSGQYDLINGLDLQAINGELTVGITYTAPNFYDFDLNDVINSIEQAIILGFDANPGFIDQYADGVNLPAKDAFQSF